MVIGFITTSYRQYFKVPNGEKVDYCTFLFVLFVTKVTQYRRSSTYAVNVETQKENRRSKNRINQGYLVVLKGRKVG